MSMKLLVICGATASGKSALAVEIALRVDGEIVSCDSMQLYKGMDIGTATPDESEMRGVKHHLISVVDPSEKVSAAAYREMAIPVIGDIASRGKVPILCGGTGLYIDALTKPLGFSVNGDEGIRERLGLIAQGDSGRERLHDMLEKVDAETASRLHVNDVRRVIRALEVYEITGKTLSEHKREDAQKQADFEGGLYAIRWPRETLYERINMRVDRMIEAGLLDEAQRLFDSHAGKDSTAMQAIGYKELVGVVKGERTLADAAEEIKQNTRHYAKRQITWFGNDPRVNWLEAGDLGRLADEIILAEEL